MVDGSCGIFVSNSTGHDSDDGSKTNPVKTLAHAIGLAVTNGSRIYACAEEFDEAITLPAGTSLFGALDCAHGWAYAASTPTSIVAPADQIAMTLAPGAATSAVSDVSIAAVDATAAGGSSIAVFANAATATLERCTLAAGVGAAGTPGAAQQEVVTPAMADGLGGNAGCTSAAPVVGGAGGTNACAISVIGGSGGTGTNSLGGPGTDGSPQPMGTPPKDGKGGPGGASCTAGDGGADGPNGSPGSGAASLGSVVASGYAAPAATDGASAGTPGQGGGGGGGAGLCGAANSGRSGGGGGAGGCGGAAGKAGTSGGSSIGLASFNAHVTLKDSAITSAHAGDGGLGGDGQKGGAGGNSGDRGGQFACGGGAGGKGGNGGPGGGGAGGSSLGIAFHGGDAPIVMSTMITTDAQGAGALGGNAGATAKGADGLACKTVDLGDASSCTP